MTQTAEVTSLILLSLNAVTHWMDSGPGRRVSLPFSQDGQTIAADIPSDLARAIPGFYRLIALVDDIPSTGIIVQVI